MQIILTEEEKEWIEKKPFNWTVKKGCPTKLKKEIKKKLKLLEKRQG